MLVLPKQHQLSIRQELKDLENNTNEMTTFVQTPCMAYRLHVGAQAAVVPNRLVPTTCSSRWISLTSQSAEVMGWRGFRQLIVPFAEEEPRAEVDFVSFYF